MAGHLRSSLTGSDHGFRRQRARSPRQSRARASPPPFPLRTMGAAGQTRYGPRSTYARPSTRSAKTCSRQEPCATSCEICCATGRTVVAASTGWLTRSESCAPRHDDAAISEGPWIRSGPRSTKRSPPSGIP